jgi:iron-sulfur cluster repair protein YtfE (RIC family)
MAPFVDADLYRSFAARLEQLDPLAEKVARVHGASAPELISAHTRCQSLAQALQVLAQSGEPAAAQRAAAGLQELRGLLHGFEAPANACRSQRALFGGLAELDQEASAPLAALAGSAPLG